MRAYIVAHSHIDAAWLWTLDETIEVCRESFLRVLDLLDKHKAVKYVQSSALYYEWMEKKHPEVAERIRKAVKEGKWEPVLPWVEFDTNIPMGESLIRQILYAKSYFLEHLGYDPKVVWLPDTFGFNWALPTIMAGFGIKYFLTHKLRWNDTVLYPMHYFYWQGPDGSKVLAHITFGGYGGEVSEKRIKEHLHLALTRTGYDLAYVIYGHGDHGGGIDEEMAEAADKLAEKGKATPALPTEFFREVEKLEGLPTWSDELYFQYHRGCLVTQAAFKRRHRIAERLVIDAEKLALIASWLGSGYPADKLRALWKDLLTMQFHDIIAGSSIREVYEEGFKVLSRIGDVATRIIAESLNHISDKADIKRGEYIVFNTLPWTRNAVVETEDGAKVPIENVPSLGYKVLEEKSKPSIRVKESGDFIELGNGHFSAKISKRTGAIVSLVKDGAELIDASRGGAHIQVFDDTPVWGRKTIEEGWDAIVFDAWELYHLQKEELQITDLLEPVKIDVEIGEAAVSFKAVYIYKQEGREDSKFEITYTVYSGIPWLEVSLKVDWHAVHKLAKFFVPLNYYVEEMLFDQPYSWIARKEPGSPNATLYDKAKWEVPGQMWAYAPRKEGGGLALLDDGLYGYDFGGRYLRLSIIRAAKYPKPWGGEEREEYTDQGRSEFRIALYPVPSGASILDVVRAGFEFNFPPLLWKAERDGSGELPREFSFAKFEGSAVPVAFKACEKGVGFIVRVYEVEGKEQRISIDLYGKYGEAYRASHDEKKLEKLPLKNGKAVVNLRPFEIATLLFE